MHLIWFYTKHIPISMAHTILSFGRYIVTWDITVYDWYIPIIYPIHIPFLFLKSTDYPMQTRQGELGFDAATKADGLLGIILIARASNVEVLFGI